MKLVILIGLSGSGKTTYYNKNLKDKYLFYDDYISNIFDGKLINELKRNEKDICIADPRLCNYSIFLRLMNLLENYINKSDINIILFENDKEKCIKNAIKRGNRNVKKSIEFNSIIYNLENYKDYNYRIMEIMI